MSQQTPYGAPAAPPPSPAPGGQQPGFPPPGPPQRTNTMAILGLVFAFVFSPLGIVFSAMGLSQTRKRGEGGRGLAVTGLVLSIVFTLIGIAVAVVVIGVATQYAEDSAATAAEPVVDELTAEAPAGDGVAAACDVIMTSLLDMETEMATAVTPEEVDAAIGRIRSTMEGAAASTSDATFVADVQLLSDGLQELADVAAAGGDTTELERELGRNSGQVGATCGMAGWTE